MNYGVGPIIIRRSVTEICAFAGEIRLLFKLLRVI